MYKSTAIGGYIINLYNKLRADKVKDRDVKILTPEEGAEINSQIMLMLQGEFIADKPPVSPKRILSVYGPKLPALKRLTKGNCQKLTGMTKAQREEIQRNAAYKYAEGLAKIQCYSPITNEDLPASRQEQAVYFVAGNYKDSYVNSLRKMKDDYYVDRNMTPDEIAREKALAKDMKNWIAVGTIMDLIEKRGELYNKPVDDETLINNFPQIAADSNLLNEAVVLLEELKKDLPRGITKPQLDELIAKAYNMTATGVYYTKRMAMLADPYYPEINLEELYKATPEKLNEVAEASVNMQMGEYPIQISGNENITELPADAAFAMKTLLDAKITRLIGGTMSEARRG
ncbi:MAG: hypothetical protein HUJ70_07570, partial [Pseudobutyrivibrio sp.]|nr:hypothetical protein [Pseudobutyrivibrio sp.]MCF0187768.1 hypothetical protein [Bacteroidaceae bacterium]